MNTEWLEKCAQAGEFLYGIYPYEVLMQMYRLRESGKVRKTELRAAINGSAALMLEYVQRRLLVFYEMGYQEAGYILPYLPQDGEAADFFAQAAKAGNPYAVLHVDPDEVEYLLKEQGDRRSIFPLRWKSKPYVGMGTSATKAMKSWTRSSGNTAAIRA